MREPLHDASVSGSGVRPEFGGPVHAEGPFSKVRRGLIGIRPRDASGVGARAALLLLLLQAARMRAVFFRRLGARCFAGIAASYQSRDDCCCIDDPGDDTTRSERETPGRPAVRACSVLAPAVTGPRTRAPLMGAWRAPPRLPSSQTGKLMSISRRYGVPLTGSLRDHGLRGDSPGGRSFEAALRSAGVAEYLDPDLDWTTLP